jgi:dienelactone hydrolase
MQIDEGVTEKGVTERAFTMARPQEPVPGVLWTPEGAAGPRPLVLLGHGGTQHKRAPNIVSLARRLVRHHGFAAIAIDLPYHGDRAPAPERDLPRDEQRRRLASRMFGRGQGATTEQALGDWTAVLDAAQGLDEVGAGPVGYWGVSMGTHFGVPLVVGEPRITAAVLGLFGWAEGSRLVGYDDLARRVTVPLLFLVQWDDEVARRDHAFELFGLFGSDDKALHANPGRHVEVPLAERDAAEAFFAKHLGATAPAAAAAG